jgi:hypothetical protein
LLALFSFQNKMNSFDLRITNVSFIGCRYNTANLLANALAKACRSSDAIDPSIREGCCPRYIDIPDTVTRLDKHCTAFVTLVNPKHNHTVAYEMNGIMLFHDRYLYAAQSSCPSRHNTDSNKVYAWDLERRDSRCLASTCTHCHSADPADARVSRPTTSRDAGFHIEPKARQGRTRSRNTKRSVTNNTPLIPTNKPTADCRYTYRIPRVSETAPTAITSTSTLRKLMDKPRAKSVHVVRFSDESPAPLALTNNSRATSSSTSNLPTNLERQLCVFDPKVLDSLTVTLNVANPQAQADDDWMEDDDIYRAVDEDNLPEVE